MSAPYAHHRTGRLALFFDEDGREELFGELEPVDVLKFRDTKKYKDRLSAAQKQTGERDALIAMRGTVESLPMVAVAFEFSFMGGQWGRWSVRSLPLPQNYACRAHSFSLFLCKWWRTYARGAVLLNANG